MKIRVGCKGTFQFAHPSLAVNSLRLRARILFERKKEDIKHNLFIETRKKGKEKLFYFFPPHNSRFFLPSRAVNSKKVCFCVLLKRRKIIKAYNCRQQNMQFSLFITILLILCVLVEHRG
jgi:hypothetical protein